MKKLILTIFALSFVPVCFAGSVQEAHKAIIARKNVATCADVTCDGFLVCQNFEGAGYDNSESWTEGGGTVDEDDTTATVLRGDQQLKLTTASGVTYSYMDWGSEVDTAYVHVIFKMSAFNLSVFELKNDAGTTQFSVFVTNTTGTVKATHGTNNVTTTDGISINTPYHIWFRYTKGTGANGIYSVAFSSDEVEPTSGTKYASESNGTSTDGVDRLTLYANWQNVLLYFDQVLVKTTEIGDVCE